MIYRDRLAPARDPLLGREIFFYSGSQRNTADDSGSASDDLDGVEVGGRLNGGWWRLVMRREASELRIWNCREVPSSPGGEKGATVLHGPSLLIEIEF